MDEITIYVDGAVTENPGGRGGWAWIRLDPTGEVVREVGHAGSTTNNRMELQAVIEALAVLSERSQVLVISDSRYVIDGATKWLPAWKRRGWRTKDKEPVKNRDLWDAIDGLLSRHVVTWQWVRGHAGNRFNEECDRMANAASLRSVTLGRADDADTVRIGFE